MPHQAVQAQAYSVRTGRRLLLTWSSWYNEHS